KSAFRIAAGLLVVVLTMTGCGQLLPRNGWIPLFDGTSLDNWEPQGAAAWTLTDGLVQADKSSKGAGFLVTKNSYKDFELRVEFWVSDDANSGIFMRCAAPKALTDRTCYEANIFDKRPDPSYGTGAIVHRAVVNPMPKAGGKWNVYEISAKGSELTVKLNGAVTVHMNDKELQNAGPIGLQYGAGVVKFRQVLIKPL
ncbi:MAG: hypothetical protein JWO70_3963, partial [Betaproteobacteria bacterium]|nr:hypothetical protein [Betaproteobacteria bacterium]